MNYYLQVSDLSPGPIPADLFLQLTDRAQVGTPDPVVINAAIAFAENRLHGLLARRYQLPLDATDPILLGFIKPLLITFTYVALHERPSMVTQELLDQAAEAEKVLKDIRDGQQDLPATHPPATAGGETKVIWSQRPTFEGF